MAFASLAFCVPGCGTISTAIVGDATDPLPQFKAPSPYSGVRFDAGRLKKAVEHATGPYAITRSAAQAYGVSPTTAGLGVLKPQGGSGDDEFEDLCAPLFLADLPGSFLADTLLIPLDAPRMTAANAVPGLDVNHR